MRSRSIVIWRIVEPVDRKLVAVRAVGDSPDPLAHRGLGSIDDGVRKGFDVVELELLERGYQLTPADFVAHDLRVKVAEDLIGRAHVRPRARLSRRRSDGHAVGHRGDRYRGGG